MGITAWKIVISQVLWLLIGFTTLVGVKTKFPTLKPTPNVNMDNYETSQWCFQRAGSPVLLTALLYVTYEHSTLEMAVPQIALFISFIAEI